MLTLLSNNFATQHCVRCAVQHYIIMQFGISYEILLSLSNDHSSKLRIAKVAPLSLPTPRTAIAKLIAVKNVSMVPSRLRVPLYYCQTINLSHLYIWKCKSISWRESNGQLLCTKAQLVAILKNLSEVAEFVPKMTSNHHYKWTFVHYPSDTNDKSSLIFYASRSCHNVQNSLRVHKRRTENST